MAKKIGFKEIDSSYVITCATAAGTSVEVGDPVKLNGNVVTQVATGDPEIATDRLVGIAVSASTDTASAAGTVEVRVPTPGVTIMQAYATTPGNLAEGVRYDTVTFDVSGTDFTIDEDEGDDADVHGLMIIDFNTDTGIVDFVVKSDAALSGQIA